MAFTFFFRDLHTLEHMVNQVVANFTGFSRIKIWDAGCAHGPEPYSLAILFAERMGRFAYKNLQFDATDIDGSDLFGSTIREGVYPEEELKRIPPELFAKYFRPAEKPGHFLIDDTVRARLTFRKHDLLTLQPPGEGYALVLCKNVLLHFQPQERVEVIRMFHRTLLPGGFFATEQTQKMPPELEGCFTQVFPDAQLFRKVDKPNGGGES